MHLFKFFTALLLLWSMPASARWLEASSDHFVIYADASDSNIRRFAERLERFHQAMGLPFDRSDPPPSPSNRVTIYVVDNTRDVQDVMGTKSRLIAGFYRPSAGGTIAVVPELRAGESKEGLSSEQVLMHEYAHHFMYSLTTRSWPIWYGEGFAEFYSTVEFERDGGISLGVPALHRLNDLRYAAEVPLEIMLDSGIYRERYGSSSDDFYARSWLLYHYLTFEESRKGQFNTYMEKLVAGDSEIEAAREAFGDLDTLDSQVKRYADRRRIKSFLIPPDRLKDISINLRVLSAGEAEMMPVIIQSRSGVDKEEAASLVLDARRIAAKFPKDPAVQTALAEAEFDAGFPDAAIAAADRAIAADPKAINAYIQKGYALARKAEDSDNPESIWKEVRRQFIKVNRIENNHPIPLIWFYKTYVEQGVAPPDNAKKGLEWAMKLAPFDGSLRWMVANQMIADQRFADAVRTLRPLAYSPHGGEQADQARTLLEEVEKRVAKEQAPSSK